MHNKIKVYVVEDYQVLREHYVNLLHYEPDIEIVGWAANSREAIIGVDKHKPDVVLMDIEMESSDSGLSATKSILERHPEIKIIMLTVHDDESSICKSFQAGAANYVLKSTSAVDIIKAIKDAYNGLSNLSPAVSSIVIKEFKRMSSTQDSLLYILNLLTKLTETEVYILILLCEGMSQKEICRVRHIELTTVKTHVKNILRKFDRKSSREVVKIIDKLGLLPYLKKVAD